MTGLDLERFRVEAVSLPTDWAINWLLCDRCEWHAEIEEPLTLAELVRRAGEHTEVCR